MTYQIIKEPNELFGVWDTSQEAYIKIDLTKKEIIDTKLIETGKAESIIKTLNKGERYKDFLIWDETIRWEKVE